MARLISALTAVLLGLTSAPFVFANPRVSPPPPSAQRAVDSDEMQVHRDFADWMQRVSAIVQRADTANQAFAQFNAAFRPDSSQREMAATARELRVVLAGSRATLEATLADLATVEPFRADAEDTDYPALSEAILRDVRRYIDNMLAYVGVMDEAATAIVNNDRRALERLAPSINASASVLIEGQILTLRTRQRLMDEDTAVYHTLGAMIAMYEGMLAIGFPVTDGAQRLAAAADTAARWGQSGREAILGQRTTLDALRGEQREIAGRIIALEDTAFQVNDRVVGVLRAALADGAASAKPDDALANSYLTQLAQLESEYIEIGREQVVLFQQLTQEP
ncbi:MAG: hypothetical protein K2P58_12415 [Hyphomonadaceae bacterium]|nr:hypothetical protein [Hyphomonadaceae bacterium]